MNFPNLRSENAGRFALLVLSILFTGNIRNHAAIDFGPVLVTRSSEVKDLNLHNKRIDRAITYELPAPTPPFKLVAGTLSGSIPPQGTVSISFQFTGAEYAIENKQYEETLRGRLSEPSTPTLTVILKATVIVPKVINFRKRRAWSVDESLAIPALKLDSSTLLAECFWDSSTGNLEDLNGVQIREMLRIQGLRPDPNNPNRVLMPPPFIGGGDLANWSEGPRRWNAAARDPAGLFSLSLLQAYPETGALTDGHGSYPYSLSHYPLEGSFLIEQVYQYGAPWMKIGGSEVWVTLLPDQIRRSIYYDVDKRWKLTTSSLSAGEKTVYATLTPLLIVKQDRNVLLRKESNQVFQKANSLDGPWIEVPNVGNELPVAVGSGAQFFRTAFFGTP